jgi:hypothetical protein
METPEWMTKPDKHMLGIEVHQAVSWVHFGDYAEEQGGSKFDAIEQKRHEECTVAPGPGNDVIMAAISAMWRETPVTSWKVSGKEDLRASQGWLALVALSKTIPALSEVMILLESADVVAAVIECERMEGQHFDPINNTDSLQRRGMPPTWKNNGIQGITGSSMRNRMLTS